MRYISLRGTGLISFFLCASLSGSCAHRSTTDLVVSYVPYPDYPIEARQQKIEGDVEVDVFIGTDGKVIDAVGKGPRQVLVQSAEANARRWIFGPFPRAFQFPINHKIIYKFEFCTSCKFMLSDSPIVRTNLPDQLEIISEPVVFNHPLP